MSEQKGLVEEKGFLQLKSFRTIPLTYTIPVARIAKFWEGLKEGKLYTTKCKKCGKVFFPPSADCPDCMTSDMDWVELSGDAELVAFTEIHVKPATFSQYPTYIVAVGQLKEGPRALAWLTGVKREDVKVGMKLKLKPVVYEEGRVAYEFVPA